jgi:hypothetical protein
VDTLLFGGLTLCIVYCWGPGLPYASRASDGWCSLVCRGPWAPRLSTYTDDAVVALVANETGFVPVAPFVREPRYKDDLRVNPDLEQATSRSVKTTDTFVPSALWMAGPSNAEEFYRASERDFIVGRCIRLGRETPVRHYCECSVDAEASGLLELDDFWDSRAWTHGAVPVGEGLQELVGPRRRATTLGPGRR